MAESDWKYLQYNVENGQKRTSDGPSGGPSSLADLDDTSISNPSNGQMLGYDGTEGKWKNVAAPAGSVTDVEVDGTSVVNPQTGVAEITMPNVPVQDVQVDGTSVVNSQGIAEIQMPTPPTPDYPVTDVKVNGTSVVSNKQALITSYKEVTQAQYEALPDTKLNDGILYAIKDGGQAVDGFPPLIYSYQERQVGVWVDGKPLYEKTVHKENQQSTFSDYVTIESIQNAEFKSIQGIAKRLVSGIYTLIYPVGSRPETSTNYFIFVRTLDENIQYFIGEYGTQITDLWLTVRYTKTTDTPGSGTWNQQGAIAHHYSTDEKVIGTWIDGKPLYEKTIYIDSIPSDTNWHTIVHNISNLKRVINAFAIGVSSTAGTFFNMPNYRPGVMQGISIAINSTNVQYMNDWQDTATDGYITIQYTKTTD